ncbi:MAG: D-alanyl-D-alanine carboxypeptidase [Desulfobulbaceae bacterium DB1]|nr:MAG: D-alanyl-D-alanine carboxypeptidase [Desulfobulbaceae bacterium DB1]
MKRLALCFLLLILSAPVAMAARTPLNVLSADPYVSALVIDADSGKTLFEENADAPVYPASVLKLMDLYVILDRIEQGALKLDEMVQVTPEAAKIGGSQVYLDPKEQFSVEDLIYALMVQSANDAAVALAGHIAGSKEGFVALMNQKAQELGMKNSRFHSVHGLPPSDGQQPDVTTARDLAILCRELAKRPEALKYTGTRTKGFREDKFIMHNHNKLLTRVPGCDGFKTGYYEAAGFSIAATAEKGGVRIITLVMGSKDRKVRDAKAAELLGKGFSLVPPQAERAPSAPNPAVAQPQQTVAAPIDNSVPPAPAAPTGVETAAQPEAVIPPSAKESGSDWNKFFMGMGSGFLLLLVCLVGARVVRKKRPDTASSKHKKRD